MTASRRALVVEDDAYVLEGVKRLIERYSYEVDTATNAADGKALAEKNDYVLVISDNTMPQSNGLAPEQNAGLNLLTAVSLLDRHKETALVLYTGEDPMRFQSKVARFGGYCVQKPSTDFLLLVRQLLTGEK